ncbi:MAG: carbonic anhydrase [Thermoanaerobaculia bacterium]|nr:carbonic anhydrase [Thermoanaerobaculia bacterium]
MSRRTDELLARNERWAEATERADPDFFRRLASLQAPRYLWIGCSDSRVPATQITDLAPGEIFVHRNVANVISPTDLNLLSAVQFALDVLAVDEVVVCGHYGCGGVGAVLRRERHGLVDHWLRAIVEVRERHEAELAALPDDAARLARLCELNVAAQVDNLCRTSVVRDAWRRGRDVAVHGWIYGVADGRLRDLGVTRTAPPAPAETANQGGGGDGG